MQPDLHGFLAGTPESCTPSTLHSLNAFTTADQVDVYSFGVVLWEICTGRVPTRGRLADPDVPGDCPADILMLIRECMQVCRTTTL